MIDPTKDGINHINVFSRGKTWLGRQLSNFAHAPFTHPLYGPFASVEGFWYWLGCEDDNLRELVGGAAKKYGRSVERPIQRGDFETQILMAVHQKLIENPDIRQALLESTLPLRHYYVFGDRVIMPKVNDQFILDFYEAFRGAE